MFLDAVGSSGSRALEALEQPHCALGAGTIREHRRGESSLNHPNQS